jgi:hypothetical protein
MEISPLLAGDRGVDLRRRADQRHAPVLSRTVPRRRRGLLARHRAPPRRRARSEGGLGRLALRQPLGQGGGRAGAARAQESARGGDRRSDLSRLPRAPGIGALPRAGRGRRPSAAPPLGEHGTKDPAARETLYVEALAAPDTIDTMPDKTLEAFVDHGELHGPMAYVLWTRFLRHNPKNPRWWDRDRFVLSAGHGSALRNRARRHPPACSRLPAGRRCRRRPAQAGRSSRFPERTIGRSRSRPVGCVRIPPVRVGGSCSTGR